MLDQMPGRENIPTAEGRLKIKKGTGSVELE